MDKIMRPLRMDQADFSHLISCNRRLAAVLRSATAKISQARPVVTSGENLSIALRVNDAVRRIVIDPRTTLLDTLREHPGLTGTNGMRPRRVWRRTVLVDKQRTLSCMALAIMREGKQITTIEGMAIGEELTPIQKAFIEQDGFQCGFFRLRP
jgi:xanthine dehydrogenase YagT iron-sulfur-binding subunit